MTADDKIEVLLINPPYHLKAVQALTPPLGLGYIAACLKRRGIRADILDCVALGIFADQKIKALIKDKQPMSVGITTTTPMIVKALQLADLIKETNPDIKTILGGPHITALALETLQSSENIDIVVRGEGEITMVELIENLLNNRDLSVVSGIAYRKDGRVYETPPRRYIADLDTLPFPAYELLPMARYRPSIKWYNRTPFVTMITSRGCPFNCIFCDCRLTFGRKTHFRSVENVVAEIEYLIQNHGTREIIFYDDTFTVNKSRVHKICDLILSKGLDITWGCLNRVDTVDEALLRDMKRAGCHMVSFGVESGSELILKDIRKGITVSDIVRAFTSTKKVGLETAATFVLGTPGETPETLQQTLTLAKRIDPTYGIFFKLVPFPGTELYELYLKQNPGPETNWENFVQSGNTSFLLKLEGISSCQLEEMSKKIYRDFYLRPRKLTQYLMRMSHPYRIKGYFRALGTFLKIR